MTRKLQTKSNYIPKFAAYSSKLHSIPTSMAATQVQMFNKQPEKSMGKWRIDGELGEGAFGSVYLVSCALKGSKQREFAAMKVEERKRNKFDELLRMELYVLQKLQAPDGQQQKFFCTIRDQGQTDRHNYLVITLLEKPLWDLRRMQIGRKFSMVTTLKIGIQLVSALRRMHQAGFIHRDIKPANMAPGYKIRTMIYLFDFGLARFIYTDGTKKKLRDPRPKARFRGTHRYCSCSAQKNKDQGRVDDLWSVLYCLIEFCTGKVPWAGLSPKEKERMKETISDDALFKNCPDSFRRIKRGLCRLGFADEPDYAQYQCWLNEDLKARGVNVHGNSNVPFEWEQRRFDAAMDRANAGGGDEDELADRQAVREVGDDDEQDSVRTADTLFSDTAAVSPSMRSENNEDVTVEDTMEDLPDSRELRINLQRRRQQEAARAAAKGPAAVIQ